MEPSWMRFEPAINTGVAYSIYVGGATGSMGSLQNFSTQHKTRNQEFFGSIRRSFSEFLLPVAACPCLPLSENRHVKKRQGVRCALRCISAPSSRNLGTFSRLVPEPSNLYASELKRVRGYWFLRFLCYWKLSRLPEGPLYTMINILAISLPSFFTSSVSSYMRLATS